MILFQKPYLTIRQGFEPDLLHVKWGRFENSYEYREGLAQLMQLAQLRKITNWIFDLEHMSAIRVTDQNWTAQIYIPQLFNTGAHKLAIIQAEDFFSNAAITRLSLEIQQKFDFQISYFTTYQGAEAWIKTFALETEPAFHF